MKLNQFTAAMTLIACAFSASAMQPIADAELSKMTGQDGLSILADMKLNIGSLAYQDAGKTTAFSLNTISVTGLTSATVDVIKAADYNTALTASLTALGILPANTAAVITSMNTATGYTAGSDVLQIAFPSMPATAKGALLNVSVASMSTGNSGASMGGLKVSDINMGGSKVWIFGH